MGLDVAQSLRQNGDPFVCGRMRVRTQETNGPQLPRLLRVRPSGHTAATRTLA